MSAHHTNTHIAHSNVCLQCNTMPRNALYVAWSYTMCVIVCWFRLCLTLVYGGYGYDTTLCSVYSVQCTRLWFFVVNIIWYVFLSFCRSNLHITYMCIAMAYSEPTANARAVYLFNYNGFINLRMLWQSFRFCFVFGFNFFSLRPNEILRIAYPINLKIKLLLLIWNHGILTTSRFEWKIILSFRLANFIFELFKVKFRIRVDILYLCAYDDELAVFFLRLSTLAISCRCGIAVDRRVRVYDFGQNHKYDNDCDSVAFDSLLSLPAQTTSPNARNKRTQSRSTDKTSRRERTNRGKEIFLFWLGKNRENYSKFWMNEIVVNSEFLTDSMADKEWNEQTHAVTFKSVSYQQ